MGAVNIRATLPKNCRAELQETTAEGLGMIQRGRQGRLAPQGNLLELLRMSAQEAFCVSHGNAFLLGLHPPREAVPPSTVFHFPKYFIHLSIAAVITRGPSVPQLLTN